MLDRQTGVTE